MFVKTVSIVFTAGHFTVFKHVGHFCLALLLTVDINILYLHVPYSDVPESLLPDVNCDEVHFFSVYDTPSSASFSTE